VWSKLFALRAPFSFCACFLQTIAMDEAFFPSREFWIIALDVHELRLAANPWAWTVFVAGPDQLLGPDAQPAWDPPDLIQWCDAYLLTQIMVCYFCPSVCGYSICIQLKCTAKS
jgi:hypothetical protein